MDIESREELELSILESCANDYEPFLEIIGQVLGWLKEKRIKVSEKYILETLRSLIKEEYIAVYLLSPIEAPKTLDHYIDWDLADNVHFYVTPKGLALIHKRSKEDPI